MEGWAAGMRQHTASPPHPLAQRLAGRHKGVGCRQPPASKASTPQRLLQAAGRPRTWALRFIFCTAAL